MLPFSRRLFGVWLVTALITVILLALWLLTTSAYAATLPTGFIETRVVSGLSNPTSFEIAPDGRIFVTQQHGELRVIKNGVLLANPFLTVNTETTGERGLLGVAFAPDFATSLTPYVYIYYTVLSTPRHNRISRFLANGDVAGGSEEVLVDLDNLSSATNHNGGAIHFGPDGKLYAAVGENANSSNAQTLANRLGKILRYNADGTIPTDNPFYDEATGANRSIWALGLRNPFTFSFQPGTGRMFINDVGQSSQEEINDGIAGSNYGWPTCEGSCNPPDSDFRDPLFAYGHCSGTSAGCAIVGSAFYNPATAQFPSDYTGDYFFADLCNGWIRRFDPSSSSVQLFATGISTPVDLRVTSDGALLYLARGTGEVWRVEYNPNAPTRTPTRTRTFTPTRTKTPTHTATRTATRTWTPSGTRTLTTTATRTKTPTRTPTRTATKTATVTLPATNTPTPTVSRTATRTRTPTFTPDGSWIFCAFENQVCRFSGTRRVRFGAEGHYTIKVFTNSVSCSTTQFGDPAVGKRKMCHYFNTPLTPTPTSTP